MGTLPRIVRILASVRVPSSYGPDVEYEMVHAVVRPDPEARETIETVVLRLTGEEGMYRGGPPEILVQDLPAVHAQWVRFTTDVFWRRAQAGDSEAQAALDRIQKQAAPQGSDSQNSPVISASGGRFGARAKQSGSPATEPAPLISSGPRKAVPPPAGLAKPAAPAPPPAAKPPAAPPKPLVPKDYQVIGFNLSTPPTAEGLLAHLAAHPHDLIIVAPASVAAKAENYVNDLKSGRVTGPPASFNQILLRHTANFTYKKLRAELATAIARMLGEINTSLWIVPE